MKQLLTFVLLLSIVLTLNAQLTLTTVPATSTMVAFKAAATYVGGELVANNTESKVYFTGAYFDEGKNFSVSTGEFIAPSVGIYHFDLRVSWLKFSAAGYANLIIRTNLYAAIAVTSLQITSTTLPSFDSNYGTLLKLKAGDKISVYLSQNSGVQQKYQQVVFSGFKVN